MFEPAESIEKLIALPTEIPEVDRARPPPRLDFGWPEDVEGPVPAAPPFDGL